jgi:hypothetical protein
MSSATALRAPLRLWAQTARARAILTAYATHLRHARRRFRRDGRSANGALARLSDLGARVWAPGGLDNHFELGPRYDALVRRLGDDVSARFELTRECTMFPAVTATALPERVQDVAEIRAGECISLQLKEYVELTALQELAAEVVRELEAKIYGAYVIVDKVYVYRNLVTRQAPQVSWLWHYDNHPNEISKVMIYLTDVTDKTAPFEFLAAERSGKALSLAPSPLVGTSRLGPDALERYMDLGFRSRRVTGKAGTLILFDNNIAHRANVATEGHRDVLVLQVRPATFRPASPLDRRWTGSFAHVDFSRNPYAYSPRLKRPA